MARDRYQIGWVEETGKKLKKWRGHFFTYTRTEEGKEVRRHRNIPLGTKSEMRKWEAEKKLKHVIERDYGAGVAKPDSSVTFGWFWENRFLPLQAGWRDSTRVVIQAIVTKHVIPVFGATPIDKIKRFELQKHLNDLSAKYSQSLVKKVRTWVKAVLEEAVEQEYLEKNPARRVSLPPTRETCKRFLTIEEYHAMLDLLHGRDQLIFRMFVLGAFRPGELFALRWGCLQGETIRVQEAVSLRKLGKPKTRASAAVIAIPCSLAGDLQQWWEDNGCPGPEEFIFPSTVNKPIDAHNLLRRTLKPAAESIGIQGLTFQSLRRTFATHFHGVGTVKDQQAQMRHSTAQITMDVYTQIVGDSVKAAMEAFDKKLKPSDTKVRNGFEPK